MTHPASHDISILNLALSGLCPFVQCTNRQQKRQKHSQIPNSTGADSYVLDRITSSIGNDRTAEKTIKQFLCKLCHQLGWLLLPSRKNTHTSIIIIREDRRTREHRLHILRQAYCLQQTRVCLCVCVGFKCLSVYV